MGPPPSEGGARMTYAANKFEVILRNLSQGSGNTSVDCSKLDRKLIRELNVIDPSRKGGRPEVSITAAARRPEQCFPTRSLSIRHSRPGIRRAEPKFNFRTMDSLEQR